MISFVPSFFPYPFPYFPSRSELCPTPIPSPWRGWPYPLRGFTNRLLALLAEAGSSRTGAFRSSTWGRHDHRSLSFSIFIHTLLVCYMSLGNAWCFTPHFLSMYVYLLSLMLCHSFYVSRCPFVIITCVPLVYLLCTPLSLGGHLYTICINGRLHAVCTVFQVHTSANTWLLSWRPSTHSWTIFCHHPTLRVHLPKVSPLRIWRFRSYLHIPFRHREIIGNTGHEPCCLWTSTPGVQNMGQRGSGAAWRNFSAKSFFRGIFWGSDLWHF